MVGDDLCSVALAPGAVKPRAFLAERLSAGALAQVLPFDVVASIAFGIVVMDTLLD